MFKVEKLLLILVLVILTSAIPLIAVGQTVVPQIDTGRDITIEGLVMFKTYLVRPWLLV